MFYSDKPISSNSDDLLKRNSFAKLLAETIANLDKADTFTVGVFGKWGSGKTSVVRMMLQELEKLQVQATPGEKIIVVHFEPWNFTDTNQLLNQFFARLSNEFRRKGDKGLKAVGDALEKYSDAFTLAELIPNLGIAGSIISFLGKNGAAAVGKLLKKRVDSSDVQSQKEYVISLLKKQTNKVLVVIDDIDRLSNEQIRQVFQLVTSVAKFPNTTYLLVFDKDIVVKALEQVQEGNGEDYLEKVIQMPIQIPDIQRSALRQILFNRLDEIIKKHNDVNFSESHWQTVYSPCVDPFIKHIRDINRLCNAVEFKLSAISGEVDFADVVAITALEIGMPAVYEWVKENKGTLTGDGSQYDLGIRDRKPREWAKIYEEQLGAILPENSSLKSDQSDIDCALKCLSHIFPHFGHKIGKTYEVFTRDQLRKNNQIAHPDKFDRYFHLTVDYIGFRKADVMAAIHTMSSEEFSAFLLERDREETSYEFLEEVRATIQDIPDDRVNVLLHALLQAASLLDSKSERSAFSLRSQDEAEYIICDLFERIPIQDRRQFMFNTVSSASCESITVLANIINMQELSYGRLAVDGQERSGFKQLLTLEGLIELEKIFVARTKDLLIDKSLFEFRKWRMTLYLLECFDAEYMSDYMAKELSKDENVLKYLEGSVTKWIGSGISYEVDKAYEKYLTTDRILKAIENQKANGDLYTLPIEIQCASAAFYMYATNEKKGHRGVSQEDVKELLSSWTED